MFPSFLAAALLALSTSAFAVPTSPVQNTTVNAAVGRSCGFTPSPQFIAAAEAHFAEHRVTPQADPNAAAKVIPVYFHVIYKTPSCVSLL